MKSTIMVLVFAFVLLGVANSADGPMYPGGGMNTCTASSIGYAIAAWNLQTCLSIPGQNCYYETIARQWALSQVLYWCYGTQL